MADREVALKKLHQDVVLLNELMRDCHRLTLETSPMVDSIEAALCNVQEDTGMAVEQLKKANNSRKKRRKFFFWTGTTLLTGGIVAALLSSIKR